jgi:hypothetical protein
MSQHDRKHGKKDRRDAEPWTRSVWEIASIMAIVLAIFIIGYLAGR